MRWLWEWRGWWKEEGEDKTMRARLVVAKLLPKAPSTVLYGKDLPAKTTYWFTYLSDWPSVFVPCELPSLFSKYFVRSFWAKRQLFLWNSRYRLPYWLLWRAYYYHPLKLLLKPSANALPSNLIQHFWGQIIWFCGTHLPVIHQHRPWEWWISFHFGRPLYLRNLM